MSTRPHLRLIVGDGATPPDQPPEETLTTLLAPILKDLGDKPVRTLTVVLQPAGEDEGIVVVSHQAEDVSPLEQLGAVHRFLHCFQEWMDTLDD